MSLVRITTRAKCLIEMGTGSTEATSGAWIDQQLDWLSGWFNRNIRPVQNKARSEVMDISRGLQQRRLYVDAWPIDETQTVQVWNDESQEFDDAALMEDEDFSLCEAEFGILVFNTDLWPGPSAVKVGYTGGMADATIAAMSAPVHTGSGLSDLTLGGTITAETRKTYTFKISTAAGTDKFQWSSDGETWSAEIAMTGAAQDIEEGITATWGHTTGHTLGDTWTSQNLLGLVDLFPDLAAVTAKQVAAWQQQQRALTLTGSGIAGVSVQFSQPLNLLPAVRDFYDSMKSPQGRT